MATSSSRSVAVAVAILCLSGPALAGPPDPSVASREGLGRVLVDGAGRTLYVFKKDQPGKSACLGDCVARWPVYLAEGAPAAGLKPEDFGTITRSDGKRQTTYKGMPLYHFAADQAPGDAKGQGMKDVWFAAVP
jgi:predicted lipoprotein with Yx(FWY)xxD motif